MNRPVVASGSTAELAKPALLAPKSSEFRHEITALRALAVIAVVLFHAWPDVLPGGFVGVDIFFVISGFLITGHLAATLRRTGTISLRSFWARRAARLLPAALTVLLATLVASWFILPAYRMRGTVAEAFASLFYVQNWALQWQSVDYLARNNAATPLEHYWSLSVEEQFYLLWPVLLLLAAMLGRRRLGRWALPAVVTLVTAASLVYCLWSSSGAGSMGYFSPLARAWEFGAGALLALAMRYWKPRFTALLGAVGWLALAVSLFAIDGSQAYPGPWTLLPVVGTCLVIAAGSGWWTGWLQNLARNGPVRGLSEISYSWYLWHWPVLLLGALVWGSGPSGVWLSLLLSVALAAATRMVIEPIFWRPAGSLEKRASWRTSRPVLLACLASAMILIMGLAGAQSLALNNVLQADRASTLQKIQAGDPCFAANALVNRCPRATEIPPDFDPSTAISDVGAMWDPLIPLRSPESGSCWSGLLVGQATGRICRFGDQNSATRIALLGDSHAAQWADPLIDAAKQRGWYLSVYYKGDCPYLSPQATAADYSAIRASEGCSGWNDIIRSDLAGQEKQSLTLISAQWGQYIQYGGTESRLVQRLSESLTELALGSARVVPIVDPPRPPGNNALCLADRKNCEFGQSSVVQDLVTAKAAAGAATLDYSSRLCREGRCYPYLGGVATYRDDGHLSVGFARSLAPPLAADIEKLLKTAP